mgnify:CR=1 FL=1
MLIRGKILFGGLMTIVLTFIFQCRSLEMSASAETELPPLTEKDMGKLFSRGDLNVVKIFLQHPGEVAQLESTGVIIQTIEPDYVVIVGDSQRIERVRRMGFTLVEPVEEDHKLRRFRVLIDSVEAFLRLRAIVCDVWPDQRLADKQFFPLYVHGRAYDSDFKWAKEAGLELERCQNDRCD